MGLEEYCFLSPTTTDVYRTLHSLFQALAWHGDFSQLICLFQAPFASQKPRNCFRYWDGLGRAVSISIEAFCYLIYFDELCGENAGNLNEGNTTLFGFNSWHVSFCCSLQENIHQLYVRKYSDYVKYWCQTEKKNSLCLSCLVYPSYKKKNLMTILVLLITEDSPSYRFFFFP